MPPAQPISSVSALPWWRQLSRYQWLVLLVAWLGWVFDIMDTAIFNFAKTPMLAEFFHGNKVPAFVDSDFLSILLVGWSVGGLIFGVLADRWGRVRTLTLTVLIYCVFTGATALCHTWQEVAVVRFVTALGIGGEWAAGAALLAEAFPDKARAPGAALLQSAAAFGPWFAAIINLGVPATQWRLLFLIGIVPALITVFLRLGLQEPAASKRNLAEQQEREEPDHPSAQSRHSDGHKWLRNMLIALVLGVCGIAAASNVSYWLPNLIKGVSPGVAANTVQARISYATLTMHVGTLLGVFAMPWLCERIGRRKALAAFFILSPISVAVATLGGTTYARLLVLSPLMSFFTIGMSAGFVLYFPELFPTRLRATGSGLAYNGGRIFAAGVPLLTAAVYKSSQSIFVAVAFTGLVPLIALISLAFAPETKGMPLPE